MSDATITRAYKRGDLPCLIVLFGKHVWTVEAIQRHLAQRLKTARLQAEREQAQRDTKIQTLSLNLSEVVDSCSESIKRGLCLYATLRFARDSRNNDEAIPSISASIDAPQTAIN